MRQRGGVVSFFLVLFLSVIILLQILLMIQSDRFYAGLNRLDEALQAPVTHISKAKLPDEYRGDEGDWLIWAMHVEPKTLNQLNVDSDIYSRWICVHNIFESLLGYDWNTGQLVPHLAKKYDVSADGLEVTFWLRDDVYFSDGEAVTADDIIFTYETIMDPNIDAANLTTIFTEVAGYEKISDKCIKFYMKKATFDTLHDLNFWDTGIYPEHIYRYDDAKEFNFRVSDPVGSGPYLFEKWDKGDKIVLRRNENYWGRKPYLKKRIYKFISNDSARLQALRAGLVDMIIPSQEQFSDLLDDKELREDLKFLSYWHPMAPYYFIAWNQDTSFFADRRVRLAMTHLLDRKQIVEKLLGGVVEQISGPFYIKSPEYDKTIKPWPYDPERAKQLLDEAGWIDTNGNGVRDKDGVEFRFKFACDGANVLYMRLAKLLKDQAVKVGIDVIIDPYEWSVLLPKIVDRDYHATTLGWGGSVIDDFYQIFHSSQIGNRGDNFVGFSNPKADKLLEDIRYTLDRDKRVKLCHEFHRLVHDQQPYTFLYARPTFRIVDKRFENVNVYYMGLNYNQWYVPKDKQKYK